MTKLSWRRLLSLFLAVTVFAVGFSPVFAASHSPNSPNRVAKVEKQNKQVLHLKLRADSGVTLEGQTFVGGNAEQTAKLNDILSKAGRIKSEKLLNREAGNDVQAALKQRLSGYYKVRFNRDIDVSAVVAQLKSLAIVETAYAEAKPAPPPSGNYVNLQKYLTAAPTGVNANYAKTYPGGRGDKVKVVDIEYGWNTTHEDLTKTVNSRINVGTPYIEPANKDAWTQHGTAVNGIMIADDNSFGVSGITPNVNLKLVNVSSQERGYDLVAALFVAAYSTQPGDVILIEQQTWGPTPEEYDFVPVEWIPEVYDMIKTITDSKRIVVEPAGNGNQNLDDNNWYGTTFPMGKPDSGAIIVGAGTNCDGTAAPRSRWFQSNYGRRVNLQGPGECVTTTGYGDLYSGGINATYTSSFNGTSAATPVVAAAAASLSSAYKQLNGNAILTPQEVRYILQVTGTPQNTSGVAGNIGPYPNLLKALPVADKQAPTTPTGFWGFPYYNIPVILWNASSDNVQVVKYQVFRNGVFYKSVTGTSFADNGAPAGTYKYKVRAVDSANRKSAFSPIVTIKVQ